MNGTGISTSLVLVAVGAVLAIAVDYQLTGIDVNAIGVILIVVGLIGLLFSLAFLGEANWFRRSPNVYHEPEPVQTHTTTREVIHEPDAEVRETRTTTTRRY